MWGLAMHSSSRHEQCLHVSSPAKQHPCPRAACRCRPQIIKTSSKALRRELLVAIPGLALNTLVLGGNEEADATQVSTATGSSDLNTNRINSDLGVSTSAAIEKDYDRYAASYDELDGGGAANSLGFDDLREELLGLAQGNVLEVAVGTGLNLKHYNFSPGRVESLTGIDISSGMLSQASARIAKDPRLKEARISLEQADATALPLPSAFFDTVVDTFSLCVIPEPLAALKQMARVVKPGGRVLLLEHARSDNPILGAYQDASASAVAATAKGCVWNQDIQALLSAAGLQPVKMQRYTVGTIIMVQAQV